MLSTDHSAFGLEKSRKYFFALKERDLCVLPNWQVSFIVQTQKDVILAVGGKRGFLYVKTNHKYSSIRNLSIF